MDGVDDRLIGFGSCGHDRGWFEWFTALVTQVLHGMAKEKREREAAQCEKMDWLGSFGLLCWKFFFMASPPFFCVIPLLLWPFCVDDEGGLW